MCLLTCGHIQHMYSWWCVGLSPETCRVKHLRRLNRNCCISLELFHYNLFCVFLLGLRIPSCASLPISSWNLAHNSHTIYANYRPRPNCPSWFHLVINICWRLKIIDPLLRCIFHALFSFPFHFVQRDLFFSVHVVRQHRSFTLWEYQSMFYAAGLYGVIV